MPLRTQRRIFCVFLCLVELPLECEGSVKLNNARTAEIKPPVLASDQSLCVLQIFDNSFHYAFMETDFDLGA